MYYVYYKNVNVKTVISYDSSADIATVKARAEAFVPSGINFYILDDTNTNNTADKPPFPPASGTPKTIVHYSAWDITSSSSNQYTGKGTRA